MYYESVGTADYLARARKGLADAKQIAALPMWRRARRTLPPFTPPTCTARSYLGATRLLGVYELATPGSVLIEVISSPLGETNMSKVGSPCPKGSTE